jgi:TonB family protein
MTIFRTAAFVLLHAAATFAFGQSNPRALQPEDKFFRPVLVIPPTSPKPEPADKLPVEIRVGGRVGEDGVMMAAEFSPLEGNEKYIAAIKDVLPLWRFRPAVDEKSCAPVASNGVVLVWFEEKNGEPSVSVSTPRPIPPVASVDAKPRPAPRTFRVGPKVEYPPAARRAGLEGFAELLFLADEKGEVVGSKVLYSVPNNIFGDDALRGSRRVRYSDAAPGADAQTTTCIVVPFAYCLSDGARYPNSACARILR